MKFSDLSLLVPRKITAHDDRTYLIILGKKSSDLSLSGSSALPGCPSSSISCCSDLQAAERAVFIDRRLDWDWELEKNLNPRLDLSGILNQSRKKRERQRKSRARR